MGLVYFVLAGVWICAVAGCAGVAYALWEVWYDRHAGDDDED